MRVRILKRLGPCRRTCELLPYTYPRVPIDDIIRIVKHGHKKDSFTEIVRASAYFMYCHVPENRSVIYTCMSDDAYVYSTKGVEYRTGNSVLGDILDIISSTIKDMYAAGHFPFIEPEFYDRLLIQFTGDEVCKNDIAIILHHASHANGVLRKTWSAKYPDAYYELIRLEKNYESTQRMNVRAM